MTTPNKIDIMFDLSGNAHALLSRNWPRQYTELLAAFHSINDREQRLGTWYIDDRCTPRLFFGLLSFAQPEIFKVVYSNPNKCFGMISDALKYMYNSPLEVDHANRLLDDQLDAEN